MKWMVIFFLSISSSIFSFGFDFGIIEKVFAFQEDPIVKEAITKVHFHFISFQCDEILFYV